MIVTRRSSLSDTTNHLEINITKNEYDEYMRGMTAGTVPSHLNEDEAEFLETGVTPEEYKAWIKNR